MSGVYDTKIPLLHVELQYDSRNPELLWNYIFKSDGDNGLKQGL